MSLGRLARGFTLVELVVAIVIFGIIGASIAVFFVPAVNAWLVTRTRAELSEQADSALRAAKGEPLGEIDAVIANSWEATQDSTKPWLLAPADLQAVKTRLQESRVQELELLRSARARELLRQHEIELISYRDLG